MITRKQRALIAVACKALGMTDEEYRDLLFAACKVRSSKNLQPKEFEKVVREFHRRGFREDLRSGKPVDDPTPPGMMTNQQRFLLYGLMKKLGLTSGSDYFRGIMKKSCGIERIAWLTREAAAKTIEALKEVERRGGVDVPA